MGRLLPVDKTDLKFQDSRHDLRGRTLLGAEGREIGRVEDLIVDDEEGRVRFLVIEQNGKERGDGARCVPIEAIEALGEGRLRLRSEAERMDEAPPYPADTGDAFNYELLYQYFRVKPFLELDPQHPDFPYVFPLR